MEMVKSKAPEPKGTAVRHSSLKLPVVEIQTFEGGFNKWAAIRDIFMAVVGNEPYVAPAQKLYYLFNKTKVEAYQLIKD